MSCETASNPMFSVNFWKVQLEGKEGQTIPPDLPLNTEQKGAQTPRFGLDQLLR